jgi:hypothetical protein
MSIISRVEKWWNQRNAMPEDKTKLLNERLARLFPEPPAVNKRANHGAREEARPPAQGVRA